MKPVVEPIQRIVHLVLQVQGHHVKGQSNADRGNGRGRQAKILPHASEFAVITTRPAPVSMAAPSPSSRQMNLYAQKKVAQIHQMHLAGQVSEMLAADSAARTELTTNFRLIVILYVTRFCVVGSVGAIGGRLYTMDALVMNAREIA
jgi:hypothetical protein